MQIHDPLYMMVCTQCVPQAGLADVLGTPKHSQRLGHPIDIGYGGALVVVVPSPPRGGGGGCEAGGNSHQIALGNPPSARTPIATLKQPPVSLGLIPRFGVQLDYKKNEEKLVR